jgi:ABC-type transport system involved in cytochrome c biogenesis permease subunit
MLAVPHILPHERFSDPRIGCIMSRLPHHGDTSGSSYYPLLHRQPGWLHWFSGHRTTLVRAYRHSALGRGPRMPLPGAAGTATYLGLELFHKDRSVGAFILPFVIAVFSLAQGTRSAAPTPPPAHGPLLALHITLNVLGYAAFALSFVLSAIYLVQNTLLRSRHVGSIVWRFPALESLERMSRSSVVVGLVSLTVGISFGLLFVDRIWGRYWNGDPKEIITVVILAVYAGYLWLGRTRSWRGARASALCVFNFIFVLFSYSVVNLYLSSFHRYF